MDRRDFTKIILGAAVAGMTNGMPSANAQQGAKKKARTVNTWLRYVFNHVTYNPDGEQGYKEFHRRMDAVYDVAKAQLGEAGTPEAKWVGYIFDHVKHNPANVDGYKEFRRRLEIEWDNAKNDLDGSSSPATKWILYIFNHSVNNPPNWDGYREFRRRLEIERGNAMNELTPFDKS